MHRIYLIALLFLSVLVPDQVRAQCGGFSCNPSSAHNLSVLGVNNKAYYDLDAGAIQAAMKTACDEWAQANSVDGYIVKSQNCGFKPPVNYFEIARGGLVNSGTILTYYPDGVTIVPWVSSTAPLGTGICSDSVGSNLEVLGDDGACYCAGNLTWDPKQKTCAPARWHDKNVCEPAAGHPIFPLTGRKSISEEIGNVVLGHEKLELIYDTRRYLPPATGSNPPPPEVLIAALGPAWTSSLHKVLVIQQGMTTTGQLDIVLGVSAWRGKGAWINFVWEPWNKFWAGYGINDTLTPTPAGYRYFDSTQNSEESYDQSGKIISVNYSDGKSLSYIYSDSNTAYSIAPKPGLLISINDESGRAVKFAYALVKGSSQIYQITDPNEAVTNLSYNTDGILAKITWPDTSFRKYVYERNDLPWALTGIFDETTARLATYGYDSQGVANETQWGSGIDHYFANYTTPPAWTYQLNRDSNGMWWRDYTWQAPQGLVLTLPNGTSSTIQAIIAGDGVPHLSSKTQPAGSGCSASASAQSYDSHGNVTNLDDFNGNRVCYSYDATRNLQTASLAGLPTTKACPILSGYSPTPVDSAHPERETTTSWHPDWVLKAKEAEPNKMTTWVYNGQPDPVLGGTASCAPTAPALPDGKPVAVLCARYEQATTDATGGLGSSAPVTGATRAWVYTYDQYGHVLSETTPRQSSNDTLSHKTTYAYYPSTSFTGSAGHTMGDLATLSNPLLQLTTFTSYDKAGRLLSSSDANGTVTSMTYFPRGWLHTQTVTPASGAPLTTTYDYWATGLLKTVTMPDASALNYTYDTAHRLTDVMDAAGNKVHYVLDNLGNRTSEQFSDATGNLASTVSRVFDALNRVQSSTGAMY